MKISQYSKGIAALIGTLATWALATFPADHNVQVWCSLAGAIVTFITVYLVPNTPATAVEGGR